MSDSTSYVKCSVDGVNGSGKSGTAVRLAIGLSLEYMNGAPVVVADTEERWRFLKLTIFDVEKVPLIICPGKSLVDLRESQRRAEKEGAGVWVGDQLTTPWMEGLREFAYPNGDLPFDRRQQLMNQWDPVIDAFRYGPYHAIGCGRLGYHWQNVEDAEGNLKLIQGDSKFNAGGGSNFGYEADLELEMRRKKKNALLGKLRFGRSRTQVEHICSVVKDAAGGILNGQEFTFPSQDGLYKKGDYKPVLDAFRPYIDFMRQIEAPQASSQSSSGLIVGGGTAWSRDRKERTGLLEETFANLDFCFPGGEGKSNLAKAFRSITLECLNGYTSISRMEDEISTEKLGRNLLIIKAMRRRIESGQIPINQDKVRELVRLAEDDTLHPGKNMSLVEVMQQSVKEIRQKKNGGAQPIVAAQDHVAEDEMDVAGD